MTEKASMSYQSEQSYPFRQSNHVFVVRNYHNIYFMEIPAFQEPPNTLLI